MNSKLCCAVKPYQHNNKLILVAHEFISIGGTTADNTALVFNELVFELLFTQQ